MYPVLPSIENCLDCDYEEQKATLQLARNWLRLHQGQITRVGIGVSKGFIAYYTDDSSNEQQPSKPSKEVTESIINAIDCCNVHFADTMRFGGRQDILSVLLDTRLGLVIIQTLSITSSESSHCFLSRDFVPF